MVKTHNCVVEIENRTTFHMTYVRDWYDSGRVADGFTWTDVAPGDRSVVSNYERDSSLAGCSGYVTYQIGGSEFSVAFSNPVVGTNKLGVGLDGARTWENMSNHTYMTFVEYVHLGCAVILECICQCTGGHVNSCSVKVRTDGPPAPALRPGWCYT